MKIKEYLDIVDSVISNGTYKDNWESLSKYPIPNWYKDAKFGAFIHWGVYSVPEYDSEWYSRNMYLKDNKCYSHHIKTYGTHDKFGYKDFIPMFKAEKFNPSQWVKTMLDAGMKYVTPVAEHHDGFKMYKSELNRWNSAEMGPLRDVLGEICAEGRSQGLIVGASSHRAEHYWFMQGGREIDSDVTLEEFRDFYGPAVLGDHNKISPSVEWCEDWLASSCEIVDKYRPLTFYFDWWIERVEFRPYIKKFAAYYYNRSLEWGKNVVLFYKNDSYMLDTAVYDMERGGMKDMSSRPWQTDTAIAKNSWSYTVGNSFKSAKHLVATLIDIVSKNGCLMLDIGPKADGSFCDEELIILKGIGDFMRLNAEGIYNTRPFICYGEGKTNQGGSSFNEGDIAYTSRDFRFTHSYDAVFAFAMEQNKKGKYLIKTINTKFKPIIKDVKVLGYDNKVRYKSSDKGLDITVQGDINTDLPICFKITIE